MHAYIHTYIYMHVCMRLYIYLYIDIDTVSLHAASGISASSARAVWV